MTGIKAIFRNGDIEEIYDLIEKNPEQEVKFCLIYEGRDIFFSYAGIAM